MQTHRIFFALWCNPYGVNFAPELTEPAYNKVQPAYAGWRKGYHTQKQALLTQDLPIKQINPYGVS